MTPVSAYLRVAAAAAKNAVAKKAAAAEGGSKKYEAAAVRSTKKYEAAAEGGEHFGGTIMQRVAVESLRRRVRAFLTGNNKGWSFRASACLFRPPRTASSVRRQ